MTHEAEWYKTLSPVTVSIYMGSLVIPHKCTARGASGLRERQEQGLQQRSN